MVFETNYKIEDYVLNTTWESLPNEVKERSIVCSIDLMTALLLGIEGKQFENGEKLAGYIKSGNLSILGTRKTFSFLGATCALGHASNSFDIDDGHNMVKGHPGASFVAGVLAAGMEKDITYREYLTSLVVSYDVAVRMGKALQDHYDYLHSTGTYGAVGTAAGVGRIFGLNREQLNNAISMAEFHAPMTPVMRAVEYPSMNKDGVPFGAIVGALAVLDTLAGETGKTHLLEMPEYAYLTEDLGKEFEIMNLYFKPYTCCRWAHQPILASIELMKKSRIKPEDIAHVKVHTFTSAARLSKIIPHATDEAQYNIAYPVATAIINGDVGYCQICDAALDNPAVLDMMTKLSFEVDPEIDKLFPEKRLAWVEFNLKDGRTVKSRIYAADGEATDHVDSRWIVAKFNRIVDPFLNEKGKQFVLHALTESLDRKLSEVVSDVNYALDSMTI